MSGNQNRVPRGMGDQRDRGRRKKHHKSRMEPDSEAIARSGHADSEEKLIYFDNWLADQYRTEGELTLGPLGSFSLNRFLQASPDVDLAPDEKLRQLAIFLEPDCEVMNQPTGWNILKRIYNEALKYDCKWAFHYHSMSLSVQSCAIFLNDEDPVREQLLTESLQACDRGLSYNPQVGLLHSARGRTMFELHRTEDALEAYEQAIALEPSNMWAALYRAHCLHNLKRWNEAVQAYQAVNISFFDGTKSWRTVLMRDQLAICLLHSGQVDAALAEFENALHRYENNPGLLEFPQYLVEAANGALGNRIGTRVAKLLKSEGFPPA